MRHPTIESSHFLFGLLREPGSAAAEILRQHGLQVEVLREGAAGPSPSPAALQAAVLALPADRRDAAWRIVAALGREKVRIEVTSPEDSFTVSFDTMAPA